LGQKLITRCKNSAVKVPPPVSVLVCFVVEHSAWQSTQPAYHQLYAYMHKCISKEQIGWDVCTFCPRILANERLCFWSLHIKGKSRNEFLVFFSAHDYKITTHFTSVTRFLTARATQYDSTKVTSLSLGNDNATAIVMPPGLFR
jgi:hypothetical protein